MQRPKMTEALEDEVKQNQNAKADSYPMLPEHVPQDALVPVSCLISL